MYAHIYAHEFTCMHSYLKAPFMSLRHLILGLLSLSPLSGYDLNKSFQATVQHFWTTDQSQIYRTLYKLHDTGLVQVEHIEQVDTPDKKVYHITPEGRAALSEWLNTPISEERLREAWLGQVFFAGSEPPQTLIAVLLAYRAQVQGRLDGLEALLAVCPPLDSSLAYADGVQLLTLDYGVKLHRFTLEWVDSAIERIRTLWESDGHHV